MKKFLLCFLMLLYLYPGQLHAQELVLHTDFDEEQSFLKNFSDATTSIRTENGRLNHTNNMPGEYNYFSFPVYIEKNRDFSIESAFVHYSATKNNAFGILVNRTDNDNFLYFGISRTGYFKLSQKVKGVMSDIIPWKASTALKQGDNLWNKLRFERKGSSFYMYINDVMVSEIASVSMPGPNIGLLNSEDQAIGVDYLTVKYLESKPINPDKTPLYFEQFNIDNSKFSKLKEDKWDFYYENGQYIMSNKVEGASNVYSVVTLDIDTIRNFSVEAEFEHISGINNYVYGLTIGFNDINNYSHFGITKNGYFQVISVIDNKNTNIISYSLSSLIKQASREKNILRYEKVGNKICFYINGVRVAETSQLRVGGSDVGFVNWGKQAIALDNFKVSYLDGKSEEIVIANNDKVPPMISLTEPMVSRGLKIIQKNRSISVKGKAIDDSGIYSIYVNGMEANVDASGNFSLSAPLVIGDNKILITAIDGKMNKGTYEFTVERQQEIILNKVEEPQIIAVNSIVPKGKYYALVIGIEDYLDESISDLEQPVADASQLYNTLINNYTFDKENITLLKNPSRDRLFDELEKLSLKVKSEDNLLIFYAGHGFWDAVRKQGYWFPSDAKRLNRSTWLTNADLKEYISAIPSKHTLLITDACFAGSIFKTRAIDASAPKAIKELYNLPSRKAMTSGTLKEVPDKSVFIEYMVKRLAQNTNRYLSAEQLFSSFRIAVINNSANGQVPQFGEIKEAGDEGGDFIFIKRQ